MTESASRQNKIENKLSAARTRLIIDNPFLGSLILQLPLKPVADDWCRTIATDARFFYYNPEYIENLNLAETQFVLSHEALHCGLSHFSRRQHRDRRKWDVACDYAVNALLKQENLTAPKGILYLQEFEGMAAEEIYPCIEDNDDSEILDEHIYDQNNEESDRENNKGSGSGKGLTDESESDDENNNSLNTKPQPLNAKEKAELSVKWQKRMASAAQQAKLAGKLSDGMNRILGKLLKPKVSWRYLLADYMSHFSRDDYSYARPSSRRDDDVIFPSLRSQQLNTVVAFDTSGSVTDKELKSFASELNAIKGQVRARVTLLGCDSQLATEFIQVFEPWDEIRLPQFLIGGGGTSFNPVFDWINQTDVTPDLLIYFTDGKADFPKQREFPVLWVIKGNVNPPWGRKIQLNA